MERGRNRTAVWLITALMILIATLQQVQAKELKPGFDADEYIEVLQRCSGQIKHVIYAKTATPLTFSKVYTSPELGLHNRWELWLSHDSSAIAINLRGTTTNLDNGLENLYAGMIPATGTLKLNDSTVLPYKFAADERALVHAGWAWGTCNLVPDIVKHLRSCYARGYRQVLVEGHSQGGALAFMLTSYLHYQQAAGALPADIKLKTYCSAAPKPGNQYYAYDFNFITRGGWAHTVVSSIDWVPETPFTVQRFSDINAVNPFTGSRDVLKKQNFFIRLYLKRVYNRTNRASRKAQRRFTHYLGHTAHKFVRRFAKGIEQPRFAPSFHYVAAGTPVVLVPDEAYYKQYANAKQHIFMHHFFEQYYFLVKHIYKNEGVQ